VAKKKKPSLLLLRSLPLPLPPRLLLLLKPPSQLTLLLPLPPRLLLLLKPPSQLTLLLRLLLRQSNSLSASMKSRPVGRLFFV